MSIDLRAGSPPARVPFYNDPKVRSIAYQVALCAVIVFLVYGAASHAEKNGRRDTKFQKGATLHMGRQM